MNIFETSYTEYLRTKKSGLRREAMTALNVFLAACGNVDTASKRQIIKDFFTRQSAEDIEIACFFPLNSQLLFPVLAEWCAENPGDSWIWRSWAYLARFRGYLTAAQCDTFAIAENAPLDDLPCRKALCRALELDPADHLARKMYIESLLETLHYFSTISLPEMIPQLHLFRMKKRKSLNNLPCYRTLLKKHN